MKKLSPTQAEQKYQLQKILSPQPFLPANERQMARFDTRKEALKNHITTALKTATNYQQFEAMMKAKNYTVLKGRGISFTDEKKVKIKGSEVGFSLIKIEKILAQKQLPATQKLLEKKIPKKPLELLSKRSAETGTPASPMLHKQQDSVATIEKEITKIAAELLKPEILPDAIVPEWLKKKREKKRKRPRL